MYKVTYKKHGQTIVATVDKIKDCATYLFLLAADGYVIEKIPQSDVISCEMIG